MKQERVNEIAHEIVRQGKLYFWWTYDDGYPDTGPRGWSGATFRSGQIAVDKANHCDTVNLILTSRRRSFKWFQVTDPEVLDVFQQIREDRGFRHSGTVNLEPFNFGVQYPVAGQSVRLGDELIVLDWQHVRLE